MTNPKPVSNNVFASLPDADIEPQKIKTISGNGDRLDLLLSTAEPDWPRSQIKKAIENGDITVNGVVCTKPGKKIDVVQTVCYSCPAPPEQKTAPAPESGIPIDIVFQDEHIIVVNKQAGLVVHPGAGHLSGTLVNALLARFPELADVGEPDRPGIVHRLDADTSGLLVIARSQMAYERLVPMFAEHLVSRQYMAICAAPNLSDAGTFDTPYGRHPKDRVKYSSRFSADKRAITHYRVICRNEQGTALVTCKLETGRTHQIRVHLSENHAPILADPLYAPARYAKSKHIERLALHAIKLKFQHPITLHPMSFDAPLPEDFQRALKTLHLEYHVLS